MKRGDLVRLKSTDEVGVVVWVYLDEAGDTRCWVAFFGMRFPLVGVPIKRPRKPYMLNYYDTSLEKIN